MFCCFEKAASKRPRTWGGKYEQKRDGRGDQGKAADGEATMGQGGCREHIQVSSVSNWTGSPGTARTQWLSTQIIAAAVQAGRHGQGSQNCCQECVSKTQHPKCQCSNSQWNGSSCKPKQCPEFTCSEECCNVPPGGLRGGQDLASRHEQHQVCCVQHLPALMSHQACATHRAFLYGCRLQFIASL